MYIPFYLVLKWLNAKIEDEGIPDLESQFFELPSLSRKALGFYFLNYFERGVLIGQTKTVEIQNSELIMHRLVRSKLLE